MEISPANTSRYTFDGDETTELAIHRDQEIIGQAISTFFSKTDHFVALVLIGGYGRGEGGFTLKNGHPSPYNDYDYFVILDNITRTSVRGLLPDLKKLAHDLEAQVGVEVDFYPLLKSDLALLPFSLMYAEMQWGHRVVAGDQTILNVMPDMPIPELPLAEFTRLMLNRGALLLLNRIALKQSGIQTASDREIFIKYLFKAILATGDAWLASLHHYHPSYPKKIDLLKIDSGQHGLEELIGFYEIALDARFHPDYAQYADWDLESRQRQAEALWLKGLNQLESVRLGFFPDDWPSYAQSSIDKGQSNGDISGTIKNILVNIRDFGLKSGFTNFSWILRYPRERLISVLPLLLIDQSDLSPNTCRALNLEDDADWLKGAEDFIQLWHRYS